MKLSTFIFFYLICSIYQCHSGNLFKTENIERDFESREFKKDGSYFYHDEGVGLSNEIKDEHYYNYKGLNPIIQQYNVVENGQNCLVLALSRVIGDSIFYFSAQKKPDDLKIHLEFIDSFDAIIKYGTLFKNTVPMSNHTLVVYELSGDFNGASAYRIFIHSDGQWSDQCDITTLNKKFLNDDKKDGTLISYLKINENTNAAQYFRKNEHKKVKKIWGVHYLRTSEKFKSIIEALDRNYQDKHWLEKLNEDEKLKIDAPEFLDALNIYRQMTKKSIYSMPPIIEITDSETLETQIKISDDHSISDKTNSEQSIAAQINSQYWLSRQPEADAVNTEPTASNAHITTLIEDQPSDDNTNITYKKIEDASSEDCSLDLTLFESDFQMPPL